MADKIVQLTDASGNNIYPIGATPDVPEFFTGTTVPSASLGKNGDIYILLNGSAVGELLYAVDVD